MTSSEFMLPPRSIRTLRVLLRGLLPVFALLSFALAVVPARQDQSGLNVAAWVIAALGLGFAFIGVVLMTLESVVRKDIFEADHRLEQDYLDFLRARRDRMEELERAQQVERQREPHP